MDVLMKYMYVRALIEVSTTRPLFAVVSRQSKRCLLPAMAPPGTAQANGLSYTATRAWRKLRRHPTNATSLPR